MKINNLGEVKTLGEIETYSPAGHSGTTNKRLVLAEDAIHFEMVHGSIESGGEADEHHHANSYQSIFVISGEAEVKLNGRDFYHCGKGDVINIPPMVDHYVKSIGKHPLEMVIVYSPPISNAKD